MIDEINVIAVQWMEALRRNTSFFGHQLNETQAFRNREPPNPFRTKLGRKLKDAPPCLLLRHIVPYFTHI